MAKPTGVQLELSLGDVRLKIPWEGRSPRDLTRSAMALYSSHGAEKSVSDFDRFGQLEIWPAGKKAGPQYLGAPLLLSLGGGNSDG